MRRGQPKNARQTCRGGKSDAETGDRIFDHQKIGAILRLEETFDRRKKPGRVVAPKRSESHDQEQDAADSGECGDGPIDGQSSSRCARSIVEPLSREQRESGIQWQKIYGPFPHGDGKEKEHDQKPKHRKQTIVVREEAPLKSVPQRERKK